jgi:homoserine O-acetyltransferase
VKQELQHIDFEQFTLACGKSQAVHVSYQLYGRTLHTAPIILVNHALTGNSAVTDWWSQQVGSGKPLDTNRFTIICIDIPGNGYDGVVENLIYNFQDWTLGDVASVFIETLKKLRVCYVYAGIGGALLWEMTVQAPELFQTIIPVAADWKATDWLVACCEVQDAILTNSAFPIEDARKHAMTFYRSPQSLKHKFNREKEERFAVQNWLTHHGKSLKKRFTLPAYKLVNHLLISTNAARNTNGNIVHALAQSETAIHVVSINTDGFFVPQEDEETVELLKPLKEITQYYIDSIHGHDAFLIEHDQVGVIINRVLESIHTKRVIQPCY